MAGLQAQYDGGVLGTELLLRPEFFKVARPQAENRQNPKGDGGKGTRKKNVTTICDKRHDDLRHVTTICDIL